MSNSLNRSQQSKVAGDLKAALISAGHEPVVVANWEPDFELTLNDGAVSVIIFTGSRSIQIDGTDIDGAQFTGRGFTDKMVAAVLDAIPAPAAAPEPPPEPPPAPAPEKTKAKKKGKAKAEPAKKDLGGPPPKRGIKLA